ncbi:hypothetical protein RFI_30007 [Reticulomyxa filosa]|uniref:Transmembrane protein n=1 Tax=Reticulomyxa filosa TaxID=46433 RepID=X6M0L0_RETFI|nr:hypothetical protein RFI_30007 [Reticulomyxa filosa]|eukprot:ETO07384.1 hypothetical protein RFI_30007 [Reticulomyxa filosa]
MDIESQSRKPRKSGSKIIKLLIVIKMISGLVENIAAIYYQSKDDHSIFWIMYGFDVAMGIAGSLSMLCCCMEFFAVAFLETAQAILFMWTSDWHIHSIIFFGVINGVQIILQWIETLHENLNEEETEKNDLEKLVFCHYMLMKCFLPIMLGLNTLPYLYFNKDSYFRTNWFSACLAVTLWTTSLLFEYFEKFMRKMSQPREPKWPWSLTIAYILNFIWLISFWVLTYVLCILFVKNHSWTNLYEKIVTIYVVAAGSWCCCICCCQIFTGGICVIINRNVF